MVSLTKPSSPQARAFVPPRFQQGPLTTAMQLGPLAFLAGSWRGSGFNAIWRPDNNLPPENSAIHRFLELNLTDDSFDFHIIPGVVPNRGFNTQPDINLYGLHYLQRVNDADPKPGPHVCPHGYSQTAGQALHIEPGLFMNVPGSQATANNPSIVRMASIPHGVTVMMQGPVPSATPVPGPPVIPPVVPFAGYPNLQPFASVSPAPPGANPPAVGIQPINIDGTEHVVPEVVISADVLAPGSQSTGPFPAAFQGFIDDPNSVLREANAGLDILGSITINLTTDTLSANGLPTLGIGSAYEALSNIPFLGITNPDPSPPPAIPTGPYQPAGEATEDGTVPNAFVYSASSTFWIEWVRIPGHPPLPYGHVQPDRAILDLEPFWGEATYLQLQYSQLVILIFNGVLWPHVSVATMTLSAG